MTEFPPEPYVNVQNSQRKCHCPLDATAMHTAIHLGAQVIGVFNEAAPVPARNDEL